MSVERIELDQCALQAWQNGAGLTREIAVSGAGAQGFDWRISVAEVDRDAPFSAFPGVDRCIVLLRGAGMQLCSRDGRVDHALTEPLRPFRFPGDVALDATLADGASSDFNVMTRRGVFRSEVTCHRSAAELPGGAATLLFCCAGEWAVRGDATLVLRPSQALLWRAPTRPISVRPRVVGAANALLLVRLCHDRSA